MKRLSAELLPAQAIAQRMQTLQLELQQARHHLRRERRAGGAAADRWGLEPARAASQEEGWFVTYLDMMTLLLVVMIVMLAFSGSIGKARLTPTALPSAGPAAPAVTVTQTAQAASAVRVAQAEGPDAGSGLPTLAAQQPAAVPRIPLQEALPYPAISGAEFERLSGLPPLAAAPLAGTFPEPSPADAQPEAQDVTRAAAVSASHVSTTATTPIDAVPIPAEKKEASFVVSSPPAPAEGKALTAVPHRSAEEKTRAAALPASGDEKARATALSAPEKGEPLIAALPSSAEEKPLAAAPAVPTEGETLAAALPLGELGRDVEVIVNQQSVSFRVNSEILFDSAQTDLSREGLAVLRRMAHILTSAGYDVTVEGHTDSVPVRSNARFPSNWELSSARAGSVVRYLQANGIPRSHLKAVGLADAHPIADNHSPEGRARNRRVELVVARHHAP